MTNVFISSTSKDLLDYREAAINACLSLGYFPIAMENFTAMGVGATEGSKRKLDEADLYVGFFAYRYGYIEAGYDKSVTEIEFDYAGERNLERLCFLIDTKFPFRHDTDDETLEYQQKLSDFKARINTSLIRAEFTDVNDFKAKVTLALVEWQKHQPAPVTSPAAGGISTAPAVLANHPDDLTEKPRKLIGRDELKDKITVLLDRGERVLLQGFGGMGKTALAATTAAEWIRAGKGATLWLKAGSASADALFEALARPFGQQQVVASQTGEAKNKALRDLLRGCGAKLLVLDDCWNGTALFTLLKAVPSDLPVLVTARQRYALDTICEVGTLTQANALQLLGFHAGVEFTPPPRSLESLAALPTSQARREGGEDSAQVSPASQGGGKKASLYDEALALCDKLGCHAFAVEIAGKNLKAQKLTPAELLKRIENAPQDMAVPADYGEAERRNVKDLLVASLKALDEETRNAFLAFGAFFAPQLTAEMLGLYVGEMGEGAQRAVHEPPLQDALEKLITHGLAERITGESSRLQGMPLAPVYRIHDLSYSYARAQSSDEQRHKALDACLTYMEQHKTPSKENFAVLLPELDNLLAGAEWAFRVERYEDMEQFAWDLYASSSEILDVLGYPSKSIRLLEKAAEAAGQQDNQQDRGAHLGNLGVAYRALGQADQAIEFHQQALLIAREIGDRRGEGNAVGNLGLAYRDLGQADQAIEFHQQALLIAREIGDRRNEGNQLGNLGVAYSDLGQADQAIEFHQQALLIAREIGDRRNEGNQLGNLGLAYHALGQADKAIEHYQQALVIQREIGDRQGEGNQVGNLGVAYSDLGQADKAIEHYQQALHIAREIGDQRGEGDRLNNLAVAYSDLGQIERAIEYYQQARAIYVEIKAAHLVKIVDDNIAIARAKLDDAAGDVPPE